jgi:hypothetical protein
MLIATSGETRACCWLPLSIGFRIHSRPIHATESYLTTLYHLPSLHIPSDFVMYIGRVRVTKPVQRVCQTRSAYRIPVVEHFGKQLFGRPWRSCSALHSRLGARHSSPLHSIHIGSGVHSASYPVGNADSLSATKLPEREANHWPPSNSRLRTRAAKPPFPQSFSWRGAELSTGTLSRLPFFLFDVPMSISVYIAANGRIIVDNELERMWKEAVLG